MSANAPVVDVVTSITAVGAAGAAGALESLHPSVMAVASAIAALGRKCLGLCITSSGRAENHFRRSHEPKRVGHEPKLGKKERPSKRKMSGRDRPYSAATIADSTAVLPASVVEDV